MARGPAVLKLAGQERCVALAVFAACLILFLLGLSPHVHWFDGGELAAAAFGLGISHPPGQPTHALLGKLFSLLPLGPVPLRIGLASAMPAAGAAAAAALLTRRLAARALTRPGQAPHRAVLEVAAALTGLAAFAPALVAGQATRIEVYALCALLWLGGLALLARWDGRDLRTPAAVTLVGGLAMASHPLIGVCCLLSFAIWAGVEGGRRIASGRALSALAVAGLVGLASWAYVPLRGMAAPALVWGDPQSWQGLVDLASGRDYWMNLGPGRGSWVAALGPELVLLGRSLGWPILAAAALGLVLLARPRRKWAACAGATLLASLAVMLPARRFLAHNPDTHGKMAVAAILGVCLAGVGVIAVIDLLASRSPRLGAGRFRRLAPAVAAAILALGLALSPGAWALRPSYPLAETYALASLEPVPSRSLVLVHQDHLAFPALYLQLVEGLRPDVALAVVGLCGNRWHLEALAARHSHLEVPIVGGAGAPGPAPGTGPLQERIATGLATANATRLPVFVEPGASLPGLGPGRWSLAPPLLHLDGRNRSAAPALAVADREFDRHRRQYTADSGGRIYRLVRLQRATALVRRGRSREAAELLAQALGGPVPQLLAPLADAMPVSAPPAPGLVGPPRFGPLFISEADQPAVALATLLVDQGQPAAALHLLRPFATGRAAAARADARGRQDQGFGPVSAALDEVPEADRLAAVTWVARRAAGRRHGRLVERLVARLGGDRPELAGPLLAIGVAVGRAGDPSRAAEILERVTRIDPHDVEGWISLAVAYVHTGRYEAARRALEQALEQAPGDPRALAYLERLHRSAEAAP